MTPLAHHDHTAAVGSCLGAWVGARHDLGLAAQEGIFPLDVRKLKRPEQGPQDDDGHQGQQGAEYTDHDDIEIAVPVGNAAHG